MAERIVEIGTRRFTKVVCLDEPGSGGACHKYEVRTFGRDGGEPAATVARANFQEGPIQEYGVNGCHQEDLLAIVIDRLRSFQSGEFSCRENAIAITKLEEALMWLNKRTADRQARGVEGTSQK